MRAFLLSAAALPCLLEPCFGEIYTWVGTAGDGDWSNSANWDANGVPVDTDLSTPELDQQTQNDSIIISGIAPTVNIPEFSGGNAFDRNNENTPEIAMLLGSMTVNAGTWGGQGQVHNGNWSSSVGDGDTGNGLAVLNYNIIQGAGNGLNRDNNSLMDWTVNADGTLNINYSQGATLRIAYSETRTIGFNLAGGTVNFANALDLDGHAGNFFDLTAPGASVTANFGGDFADLAAVNAAIGTHFISTTGQSFGAGDNEDGTFTVSVGGGGGTPTDGDRVLSAFEFANSIDFNPSGGSSQDGLASGSFAGFAGVGYTVEWSPDLITPFAPVPGTSWPVIGTGVSGTGGDLISWSHETPGATKAFYRLRFE